ncbi:MAG: PEP-CTERM sorting domain-containing protein [Planctomycetota bacterium]|jgi:hypothetical protein
MRKLLIIVAVVVLSTPVPGLSALNWSINLLTNPGAESGTMEGWTTEPPVVVSQSQKETSGYVYPRSGGWFFNMASRSVAPSGTVATRKLYQDVNLSTYAADIDDDLLMIKSHVWLQTEDVPTISGADYVQLTLRFLDGLGAEIDTLSTGLVQSPNLTWVQDSLDGVAPSGTRTVRFELLGEKHESSCINGFFDDANFQVAVIPEPATICLLGAGVLALLKKRS